MLPTHDPSEVSQLKQEVAELWRRFRQREGEPSLTAEDPTRDRLAEQARVLEGKRRLLVARRDEVRATLDEAERSGSRFVPVLTGLGLLVGGLGAAGVAWGLLPHVAELTVGFGPALGGVLLGASALFPLLLPPARR